jgi:C1A family cysteine protease
MKTILVLAAFVAVAICASAFDNHEAKRLFGEFQKKYGKSYATAAEQTLRFKNFQASLQRAAVSQALNPRAKFGVTKFSDLTPEEFTSRHKGFNRAAYVRPPVKNFTEPQKPHHPNFRACSPDPTNYDWNSCGVITPVYDQGQCGSCWAFSATETIESYFALDGGQLDNLSMQQIVDCDTTDQGCNGGLPENAYQYVEGAGGLDPLSDYPYTAEDGTCAFNSGEVVATVTNYQSLDGESGLYSQASSSSGGPVSVCVDASSWQDYQGGVLTSCGTNVDHCVQLTGYASYGQSGAYWIVRNSWGTSWGQSGYIWVAIGQDLCSIGDYGSIVTAAQKK